jgi:Na+-driven multidrug efflux pump
MIVLMPSFALGGAAATMVGQNLGAGKPARARQAAWAATFVGIGFMIVSAAIMIAFAPSLIRIFNSDPEVVTVGSRYLKVVSPFYAFAALGIVLGRALNGAGDTVGPMIITIVTLWGLQIPLALSLARVLSPSTDGIWWAIAAAFVVQGLLILAWFEKGKWKHKQI